MPQPAPNPRLRLELLHEDERLVVANKAPGMVTEPGRSHAADSLLNALVARYGGRLLRLGERRDYGLLHRLDRQTSGCVACALDPEAYDLLRGQFERREVDKRYLAIVRGRMRAGSQTVRKPLEQRRLRIWGSSRLVSVVSERGEEAVTEVEGLSTSASHSLVSCRPVTGRLHQIRIHLALLGFPIEGDPIYAKGGSPAPGGPSGRHSETDPDDETLGLHAWRLSVAHPSGGRIDAEAPPSRKFMELLRGAGLVWKAP